ncbi:MAG: dual specificity protein phosphatase family protein [Anaerohalosphaera sp.]|nr:dual specificity protein phosphatase family protein [Anaerohalosphaera sp.]
MSVAERSIYLAVIACLLLLPGFGCKEDNVSDTQAKTSIEKPGEISDQRNAIWATKIELEGCPNLHKVSDELYRSAQPEDEGFAELEKVGIKTVINLRKWHSDTDEIKGTGMNYVPIKMKTWEPEDEHVIKFLTTVCDPSKQPVLVHCQHGADRTGMMSAIYRIVVQDWEKEDAIKEMVEGGYDYHSMWTGLPKFIRELDVEKVKEAVLQEVTTASEVN